VHILYCFSLLRSVEARKAELLQKSKQKPETLTSTEQKQLEFFRNRGATYLLVSAIAPCMETFLSRRVLDPFRLSFRSNTSPGHRSRNLDRAGPNNSATLPAPRRCFYGWPQEYGASEKGRPDISRAC
jgi:hypothetical protein